MRGSPTLGELRLWELLRRDTLGVRFRRQEPIGRYIVDFVCLKRKVIVEVDGWTHIIDEDPNYARNRDAFLARRGFHVMHVPSEMVDHELHVVEAAIKFALKNPKPGAHYLY